jgi:DNA ligase-1
MNQTTKITLYKAHSMSVGYWNIFARSSDADSAEIVITHAKSDTAKAVEQIVPVVGKNIGRSNETTPFEQAQFEVTSRINKQLDKGYTYEVPFIGQTVTNTLGKKKPMLATPINKVKEEIIDWSNAWVQPKLDGHRAMFDEFLYSRQGKEIKLPHITDEILDNWVDVAHLDGELYCHGKTLQEIGSLIKKPREESHAIAYHVYDLVLDVPYEERFARLRKLLGVTEDMGLKHIKLVETHRVYSMGEAMQYHEKWVAEGYEGGILRHGTDGYEDDKRSKQLLKIKGYIGEEGDTEATIIGFKRGTPYIRPEKTYECCIFICETPEGVQFDCTAPGTMQDKHEAWVNQGSLCGKQLTYKYFCLSKDGIPQQPVALGIRDYI